MKIYKNIEIGDLYQCVGNTRIYDNKIIKNDIVLVVDVRSTSCMLYNPRSDQYIKLLMFPRGPHSLGDDFIYLEEK